MNRTVPPFKKPAFWVILAAAVCVVLGVLLLPHRSGPTQLGTSQAEPTVAYATARPMPSSWMTRF